MNQNVVKVEHIQASVCDATGARIDTLVLEYPRAIHSQLLTHRVFSKNSSSTRAIPLAKSIEQIKSNPAQYIWTQNQAGMQGKVITDTGTLHDLQETYLSAMENAMYSAQKLASLGAHKQNAGRLLEPFQNIRIVLTSTEWENWDWLRMHEAAQGEIDVLAQAVYDARMNATPMVLFEGEWHVPFVERERDPDGSLHYYTVDLTKTPHTAELTVEDAKLISMSVCAQTSYRKADYSLEKGYDLKGKLFDGDRVHASPSEHQVMCFHQPSNPFAPDTWQKGITHVDRHGVLWSANIRGFIQHRQLLPNHDKAKS